MVVYFVISFWLLALCHHIVVIFLFSFIFLFFAKGQSSFLMLATIEYW